MTDLRHSSDVQLSEIFLLAGSMMTQMNPADAVPGPDGLSASESRRVTGERRAHHRLAGRPAGSGARRNERERNRVRQVNAGFDRLRDHVPQGRRNRKLSKVDTLRAAAEYISHLQAILHHSGGDTMPTSSITDENYPDRAVTGSVDDVIDSWYLDQQFCGSVEGAPTEASMIQFLVRSEDITRTLTGSGVSTSSATDHRLTIDVGCSTSPQPDAFSLAGSADCGGCGTPESVDQEVTSSSAGLQLDDDAEQLFDFSSWLS